MAAGQRPAPEANPLVVALAEIAVAVVQRRREAEARRRSIRIVGSTQHTGGNGT